MMSQTSGRKSFFLLLVGILLIFFIDLPSGMVKTVQSTFNSTVATTAGTTRKNQIDGNAAIPTVDNLLVQQGDSIYVLPEWDAAPIVLEEFKLIFFTIPKVGCTAWKQLFRRMMGLKDWKNENVNAMQPWNPESNGLKYLYHYSRQEASEMMSSPVWTRAIMVRDPKTRFLSAYLDKIVGNPSFTRKHCCPYKMNCVPSNITLEGFFDLAQTCDNPHWAPQSRRMEAKYWPYINFVGHLETAAADAERLLRRLGGDECWKKYGATGWGNDNCKNCAIFQKRSASPPPTINDNATSSISNRKSGNAASTITNTAILGAHHATDARDHLKAYYTPELERKVDEFCFGDYHLPTLNLTRTRIF